MSDPSKGSTPLTIVPAHSSQNIDDIPDMLHAIDILNPTTVITPARKTHQPRAGAKSVEVTVTVRGQNATFLCERDDRDSEVESKIDAAVTGSDYEMAADLADRKGSSVSKARALAHLVLIVLVSSIQGVSGRLHTTHTSTPPSEIADYDETLRGVPVEVSRISNLYSASTKAKLYP